MKKAAANTKSANRPHKAIVALSHLLNHAIQHAVMLPYLAALLLLSAAFFMGELR